MELSYLGTMQSSLFLALLVLLLDCATASNEIQVYSVTVRDFLPIWCMPDADMKELDIFGPRLNNNSASGRYWKANEGINGCPYQKFIDNGTISGHPDFNRHINSGWYFDYLWDIEDTYGSQKYVTGTCDAEDLRGEPRPPAAINNTAALECNNGYKPYTNRLNLTAMDIAPSGVPKPQYCMQGDDSRCGYFIESSQQAFQTATKYFHDMWFLDNRKFNKRIGTTVNLYPKGNGIFEFNSLSDDENEFVSGGGFYAPHGHSEYIFDEEDHPDPLEAKAWPRFGNKQGSNNDYQVKSENKFFHTSEIHLFFEYQGTEFFEFSGDDDVWVYINNRMAINLGGLHPRASSQINLSSPLAAAALNITKGNIYTFDLFQAERQTVQSNFQLTTTLSSACNVIKSGKDIFPSPTGDEFKKSRGVVLAHTNGDTYFGQDIELITSDMEDQSSFIFSTDLLNVGTGFIVEFDFIATGEPSGFTFLLHRRENDLTNFPKSSGANLGFKGVKNSMAIAFDFCTDREETETDCIDQDVTVYFPDSPTSANKPSTFNRRVYDPIIRSLKYNETHKVKIEYFFKPPALEVTIDDSLYLRQMPFDPFETIGSFAAFAGFTATSGSSGSSGTLIVNNWRMSAVDVESSETVAVDFDPVTFQPDEQKSIIADGVSSDGFVIQTRDFCEADVEFGARSANAGGIYVERPSAGSGRRLQTYSGGAIEPLIMDVTIEDNDDGKYGFNLISNTTGSFDLYFYYGDSGKNCTFNYTLEYNNITELMEVSVTLGNGTVDGCFYGEVQNGMAVLPLTSQPTAAPVDIVLPPVEVDDTVLYVLSVGGGTLGFFGILAAGLFVVYARRWRKDKEFIEEGREYKMDAQTAYNGADELTQVGREVQASGAAILRIRMQKARDAREKELVSLQQENDELMEQIRIKKNAIETVTASSAAKDESPMKRRKPLKIEL